MALENADTRYEFTKIDPVFLRQYMAKESRTHTVYILLKLPSLVSRIKLLGWIPRRTTKGRGQKRDSHGNTLPMCSPQCSLPMKDSPVPVLPVIRLAHVHFTGKKLEEEIWIVKYRQMHDIESKDARHRDWLMWHSME